MLLSSLIVVLVSSTFLVQNRYYASQTLHTGAHDNARAATERIAGELRGVMNDGFVIAGARTLTVRSPIVVGMICERQGNDVYLHLEGGVAGLDTDELAGVAIRDMSTGVWDYRNTTWAAIDGGGAAAASQCAGNGADTTGASNEFRMITSLQGLYGSAPNEGSATLFFRETTFKIQASVLDSTTLGLFRKIYGGPLVEFATGMDSTAQFQYRTGGASYADTVVASDLTNIDAVRIVADARKPSPSGGLNDVTFGWSVNVALRNRP